MANAQFQIRGDTAANWAAANPVLLTRELALETDTRKIKLGDGVTAWNALPYGGIKGDTGTVNYGATVVADSVSGLAERAVPYAGITTLTTKNYTRADLGKYWEHNPSGVPAFGVLPALTAADNGREIGVHNKGTTPAETITFSTAAPNASAVFGDGTSTYVLQFGCRQTFQWTGTAWKFGAGNANLLKTPTAGSVVANELIKLTDTAGRQSAGTGIASPATGELVVGKLSVNTPGGNVLGLNSIGLQDNGNRVYSDSNPPQTLLKETTPVASPPATPAAGLGVEYVGTEDGIFRFKNSAGTVATALQPADQLKLNYLFNVVALGADPTNNGVTDSTLAFYNAFALCGMHPSLALRTITTAQVTATGTFTIPVTAGNTLPASGSLVAQTTRGTVILAYTGGGTTTTLTGVTVTSGVAGGLILSGSFIGQPAQYGMGGRIIVPEGFYLTTQELTCCIPSVHMDGFGGTTNTDTGSWPQQGGSMIYYNGPAGGTVMRFVPMAGTAGYQGGNPLTGIRCTGLSAIGNGPSGYGLAGIGFSFISCSGHHAEDLYVQNATLSAYKFTVLGAGMLGAAHDCTRGTVTNCKFRAVETNGATITTANAAVVANAAATTNLNTFAGAGVIVTPALNSIWPTSGLARVQAKDALTGNVMWYLVSYTGLAASNLGLTGVTTLGQWWNETNSTSLSATAPAGTDPRPNATMFAGSLLAPAQGGFGDGYTFHGSANANACCMTILQAEGVHFEGTGAYFGNSDDNVLHNIYWNRVGGPAASPSPLGIGVDMQGSGMAGGLATSRNNQFFSGDPGPGGIRLRGTNDYGYLSPASANVWDRMQMGNGAPVPVIGTGAQFDWTMNGGLRPGYNSATVLAPTATAASYTGLIPGTSLIIPPQGIQVGATMDWTIPVVKTAAGTTWTLVMRIGTTNSATDPIFATLAVTGTAAIDRGLIYVRVVITSTTTAIASVSLRDRALTTTGLSTTVVAFADMTMAAFALNVANPGPAYINAAISANAANVFTFGVPHVNVIKAANP
ncbi:MAG: hypothetical protein JWM31_1265 [Solirubrobacterales bacterium]|nr:hypothetical protein [Solirubrobacterales bacterium]